MEDSVTGGASGADPSVGGSAGEDSGEGNFAVGVSVLPLEAALSEMESEDRGDVRWLFILSFCQPLDFMFT